MMRRICALNIFLLGVVMATSQEWPVIQTDAKPATRWWWFGNAVDKENLTYNLESLSNAGLGGVEITPIYGVQGNETKEIPYLSASWMQLLKHVEDEGKRLNINIDMSTGTGWPFGGPHVDIADAAVKSIFREYRLTEGESLPDRVEPLDANQRGVASLSCLMAFSENQRIDITGKVTDGYLKWKAPAGSWRLIALFAGKTLQQVKRAAPGGEGYVIDHYSSKAVANYLSVFEQAFRENGIPYPQSFFNDSYEAYGADWTPGFLQAFAERRGYHLEHYFPEFLDSTRNETTRRIVSDYRETLSELLLENFTRQWTDWAHRHGSTTRNQAHGSPGNLIDLYSAVDIPECEGFGLSEFHIRGLRKDSLTRRNDSDLSMLKYASSAAHISGKQLTSSETFTWLTEHFRESLSQCKPDLDLMFTSGVNHIFFHGTPYSPKEAPWPGWQFYASINMSPTNSIWRDMPAFSDYIARCQSFQQMGQPDNDFLLYLPLYDIWDEQPGRYLAFDIHKMAERAPEFIKLVHKISSCGYDLDYISDNFIRNTSCENGLLVTSTEASRYKAIIVPPIRLIPHDILRHLLGLAQNGARIIFLEKYPDDVPGFAQLSQRQLEFQQIAKSLPNASFRETQVFPMGKGRIITGADYAETLRQGNARAEELQTAYGLNFIRRSNATGYHYFVASLQEKDMEGWISLGVDAQSVSFYNPVTGESGMAQTRRQNNQTQVYLQLRSGESIIIRTFNTEKAGKPWFYPDEISPAISLDRDWTLRFIESEPAINEIFTLEQPVSWTVLNNPDVVCNMGTALYTSEITIDALSADDWILDLGDVRESARVRINGKDAGICWSVPYRLRIGKFLQKGNNLIEIEVTNLPANRIADYDRRGINWRIFKDINVVNLNYQKSDYAGWQPLPSGLNSQVRLIPVRAHQFD
ncbi:MAG: glycosyl hydrolase family 2 [Tannerella sp.]|jgi:hypothetical protein|nr:glycosyl hydrolase family 2 [Tannerella sp.]